MERGGGKQVKEESVIDGKEDLEEGEEEDGEGRGETGEGGLIQEGLKSWHQLSGVLKIVLVEGEQFSLVYDSVSVSITLSKLGNSLTKSPFGNSKLYLQIHGIFAENIVF